MSTYNKHLIRQGSKIRQALEQLNILAKDAIVFVVDDNDRLVGSLTDGDVRRGLLKGFNIEDAVDNIIQPHPKFFQTGEYDIHKVIEYRENNFRVIPVLDREFRVVNVINFREIKSYLPVDAVIMAGGRGERLKPLTDTTPKPLLKVGEKPIIDYTVERLALYGIDDIWISVRYLGEQIEAWGGNGHDRNLKFQYIWEDEPLGTIGAVARIDNFSHDSILVTNSDILTNIDYEQFYLDFIQQNADFSVVTIPYSVDIPYAVLETDNGHVLNLREKPTYTYYSNGGIYLMKKSVQKLIPKNYFFNATDLMELMIGKGLKVISYPFVGYWLDMGKKEDFVKAQNDIGHII